MKRIKHVTHTLEALIGLMLYDIVSLMGFSRTYSLVKRCPVVNRRPADAASAHICGAVGEACIWYVKKVHCLQRSAVTTWLLRMHGLPAELVIGCRPVPVQSHAWVEIHGTVVNDNPQYQKYFHVLERI